MSDSVSSKASTGPLPSDTEALDIARAVTATGEAVSGVAMEALGVLRQRVQSVVSVPDEVLEPILVALIAGGIA